jgi:hypothetical protein
MALTLHGTVSDNTVALDRKTATPLIINGDMQIAQRGTSFSSASTVYHMDRQRIAGSSYGQFTITQDTDVPTGQGFTKSAKYDCTTADASLSASAIMLHQYRFEGQNLQMLKKGTSNAESLTVAFWVKTNKTGTYIAELFDQDNTRQISQSYTISSSNTWEKKVLSFAGDTTGALDNDNARSMNLNLYLAVGTDYTSGTLNTSWASNTKANRAVGQVNLADSTSNEWYITGLQMEVGTFDSNSIPPFQFEDRATSLLRCQRYFQKSYQYSDAPGTATQLGSIWQEVGDSTSDFLSFSYNTQIEMRSSPTIVTFDLSGTSAKVSYSGSTNGKTGTVANASPKGWRVYTDNSTSKDALVYQFTASAEL